MIDSGDGGVWFASCSASALRLIRLYSVIRCLAARTSQAGRDQREHYGVCTGEVARRRSRT